MPTVTISRRGAERLRAGHPWIYRSDIARADAEPGDLVRVATERGRPVGWAFWSSTSQIALRVIQGPQGPQVPKVNEREMIDMRLTAAIAYRASLEIDATAWRVVNAEADCLPGLIVDRYDDCLVVQTLCQGTDRRLALITELLAERCSSRQRLREMFVPLRHDPGRAQSFRARGGCSAPD